MSDRPGAAVGKCPVCGGDAATVHEGLQGYQAPARYDVVSCGHCGLSHALPMSVDNGVYDLIYKNPWKTPGYDEYFINADEVLKTDDPMGFLASRSPVYWAVERFLDGLDGRGGLRILDYGCGMGYLTYAIAKRGYKVTGLDVSPVAVEKARRRYGDLFVARDLVHGPSGDFGPFDVVTCIGMIEHVVDPVSLIKSLHHVLAPGGRLIMTTPDKNSFPANSVWETDNPPVHLWWFTKKSVETMGEKCGFSGIEFVDLSGGPAENVTISEARDYAVPITEHFFDEKGRLMFKGHREYVFRLLLRNVARKARVLDLLKGLRDRLFTRPEKRESIDKSRPANICVIFTK